MMETFGMRLETLLEQEFTTAADLIRAQAQAQPQAPALQLDENRLTYAELDALLDRLATALQRDGVQPRDTVIICADTSIAFAVHFLSGLRALVHGAFLASSDMA